MNDHLVDDDLPTIPTASVRVAQGEHENIYAHAQHGVWNAARSLENVSDEALVALMLEPEFLVDCSGLERELIIRIAGRLEVGRS